MANTQEFPAMDGGKPVALPNSGKICPFSLQRRFATFVSQGRSLAMPEGAPGLSTGMQVTHQGLPVVVNCVMGACELWNADRETCSLKHLDQLPELVSALTRLATR